VTLHRLGRQEQRRRDLLRRPPGGGQLGGLPLAGRQRSDAGARALAWPRAGRSQLGQRPFDERVRIALGGQLERAR